MAWEIEIGDEFTKGILAEIVEEVYDRIDEQDVSRYDEDAIWEAAGNCVSEVLDIRLVSYQAQLAALVHYGHIADGLNAAWEDIESDVMSRVQELYYLGDE